MSAPAEIGWQQTLDNLDSRATGVDATLTNDPAFLDEIRTPLPGS